MIADLPAFRAIAREPFAKRAVGRDQVWLLKDGAQAFPAMLDAITGAQHTICLETYILQEDGVGQRFISALIERARAGVEVLLTFDAWGSNVGAQTLAELRAAGVKVLVFKPVHFTRTLGRFMARLLRRNHRKSLIVDGQVGFTGGLNLSDDYAAHEDNGQGWRDTHVRLEGPSAGALQQLFLATWSQHRGAPYERARFHAPPPGDGSVRILGNDFAKDRKDIRRAYVTAITAARSRVFLTHAYFMPPARVLRALMRSARRGVRVAVILAASTDVKLVLWASRALYSRLLKAGVEVYEWTGPVLHAKTAVVDGRWSTVGSANLDALSLRQNLEVNAVFVDEGMGEAVERLFLDDLTHCERITLARVAEFSPWQRLVSWVAYQWRQWL